MKRLAGLVALLPSLALMVACGSTQAAVVPSAKAAAPTAASLSAATPVLLATATMVALPTSAPLQPPTSTAVPPATGAAKLATPFGTSVVSQGADWKQYRDDSRGFEFRYPGACTVAQRGESFTVGGRIELTVAGAKGLALRDYVNQFVEAQMKANGWKPESPQEVQVGGDKAIRIDYRFGGANRFGTAVFVERDNKVYTWGLTAGGFTCDEGSAFDGILSSFRLAPSGTPTPTGR